MYWYLLYGSSTQDSTVVRLNGYHESVHFENPRLLRNRPTQLRDEIVKSGRESAWFMIGIHRTDPTITPDPYFERKDVFEDKRILGNFWIYKGNPYYNEKSSNFQWKNNVFSRISR